MRPIEQSKAMISWFFSQEVSALDIHIRVPKVSNPDYSNQNDWFWITEHEKLDENKAKSLLGFCKHKNANGSDVFIRPHRNNVHPILFLDDLDLNKSMLVAKKYTSLVIETSKGNHQVWLRTSEQLDKSQRMTSQRYLSSLDYSDTGSISGDHLGRICGFKSHKRKCWVNLVKESESSHYKPFKDNPIDIDLYPQGGARVDREKTQSEFDMSNTLRRLRLGDSKEDILDDLYRFSLSRGKRTAKDYANRTLEKALIYLNQRP
jgi:hypothetical protein